MRRIFLNFCAGLLTGTVTGTVTAVLAYHLTHDDFLAGAFCMIIVRITIDAINENWT